MTKRVSVISIFSIVLSLVFILPLISAASTDSAAVDNAYKCLNSQINNRTSFSLEEAIFATLAVGSKSQFNSVIQENKNTAAYCWPKAGCKLKETAQVALVYDRIGSADKNNVKNWLLSQKGTPTNMIWYLEIDIAQHIPSSCTIRYDSRDYRVSINEDMTLSGGAGSCLTPANSNFWLRVNNNCLAKSFEITCEQDFITSTLYQKPNSQTIFVTPSSHSASSLGTTNESINAVCFKSGTSCDYEGSLWAAIALKEMGEDVSYVIPYLAAFSDDDEKYFPSAFLYALTSSQDYYSNLLDLRKQNQYWEIINSKYSKFFDTALALFALGSSSGGSSEADATKSYLISIQGKEGCWNNNNIRDTAFLLYAGWKKSVSGGGGGGSGQVSCVEAGLFCESSSECAAASGTIKSEYECPSLSICCTEKVERKTCQEENGEICEDDEVCDGQEFAAGDGACCLGDCVVQQLSTECEENEGTCRESCGDSEEETSESCRGTDVCCIEKQSSFSWWWVIILIILIIIIILLIVFRDKLRLWWFKRRGKASVTPVTRSPPPSGSFITTNRIQPRQPIRPATRQTRSVPRDLEMEETLRKLREMSK